MFSNTNIFQFLNAAAMVAREIGQIVHYEDISKETITNAVNYCLSPTIQENAQKVSYSFRNRLESPQKTAVWWIEHVALTGGATLTKSHSTNMSALIYYSFDIYLTIFVVLITIAVSLRLVVKHFLTRKRNVLKTKSD